jgi:pantetheine-phosphate adenylyltransferase
MRVIYPGSFDPIHLGHVDIVDQAVQLFGDVVVAVMHNPGKPSGRFGVDQRVDLARRSLRHFDGVVVEAFAGLAVDAARTVGAACIVKGIRNQSDAEVELQMAHTNHSVTGVRTVFLPAKPDLSFVSSRFVREIAQYGGTVAHLVPAPVAEVFEGADS